MGRTRYADGSELDNPMYFRFYPYLDTQNVMLMRYVELTAKRKAEEGFITDMLGETAEGKKIAEIVQDRYPQLTSKYPDLFGARFVPRPPTTEKEMKKVTEEKNKAITMFTSAVKKMTSPMFMFVKGAPYETNFENLITRQYFREIGDTMWLPANNYLRSRFGVPGFQSGP